MILSRESDDRYAVYELNESVRHSEFCRLILWFFSVNLLLALFDATNQKKSS